MLVTPGATAYLLVRRLPWMMLLGAVLGCFSGVFGILLAWHFSLSPSAAIVLTMTVLFLVAYLLAPGRGWLWTRFTRHAGPTAASAP